MDNRSINRLLVEMQNGDNDAFEMLYLETKRGIYAFLYTYFKDGYSTEDAVQSIYLKIKRSIGSYRAGTNAMAWILEIAKNFALDELRRQKRVTYELPDELLGVTEQRDISVQDMIDRTLTEEEARILALHVIFGYKHREIGRLLGLPLGTVTSKYKRAVEKMRKAYKGKEADACEKTK